MYDAMGHRYVGESGVTPTMHSNQYRPKNSQKKPLTKIAAQKTIAVLRKSFDEGYCPTEMINKTIAAGWQGVFAAKPGDVKTQQSRQGGRFVC